MNVQLPSSSCPRIFRPFEHSQPSHATFAGYRVASFVGPWAAILAPFAPGRTLMLLISRQYTRFRDDRRAKRFLTRTNPLVSGLGFAAAVCSRPLGRHHGEVPFLSSVSFLLLTGRRLHPAFVPAIGAATGYLGVCP